MSILNKSWHIINTDRDASLFSKLLSNRGIKTDAQARDFFYPDKKRDFHDPFLMDGMQKAVSRVGVAIESSQRVMIFGDYDVDGVTGCAILMRTLRKLGANVSYRLPHRIEDGYGLRQKFIEEFKRLNVKLIITVDNGISCFNETALANKYGIDVIITDHHAIPEKIPEAFAILHPKIPSCKYPFKDLTGAGVALKFAQALLTARMKNPDEEILKLLDLACMGTVADLGELRGENRFIVKEGLKVLENTRWPGLSRLKESAGVNGKINTHDIGFLLSPRINAAGRISHPSHALKLLLHDREHSHLLAKNLEQLNQKRQKMMGKLMDIADEMAAEKANGPMIIISHKNFHGGIIGLLAGKLSEKYFRPAIVMEERDGFFVGSCRSVPGVNIVELLASVKDLLNAFGGHAAAAGFEIPKINIEEFKKRLTFNALSLSKSLPKNPALYIDCEISHKDVSQKTIETLKLFEPFGIGNKTPRFLCANVPFGKCKTVGKEGKHLKFETKLNGQKIDCIGFDFGKYADSLNGVSSLDLICEIEEDDWNGNKKLQMKIVDMENRYWKIESSNGNWKVENGF